MKKLKICVYTICKNEEKFVERWVESAKDADLLFVGDTGSKDKSIELLRAAGVTVHELDINPWRFDVARNEALKLIPNDIDVCISLDMDELLNEDWRKNLEKCWTEGTTRMSYIYNWNFDENNKPLTTFITDKIHQRNSYIWTHPVHEILEYIGDEKEVITYGDGVRIDHHADPSKPRLQYLDLLELSVKEDPENDRNVHYLGREYMFRNMYDKAIKTLKKHLKLKTATWKDERCASMRFIGRCYIGLKNYPEAKKWLDKAILEAPYLRDPYVERALLAYIEEDWDSILINCKSALTIKENQKTYINEPFSYDHTIYDLLALSNYYRGNFNEALKNINIALTITPDNERLVQNKKFIEEKISSI
jgi:tetratricopeptide (TPR) repeat protein